MRVSIELGTALLKLVTLITLKTIPQALLSWPVVVRLPGG